VETLWVLCPI